jgi:hypothetical protein
MRFDGAPIRLIKSALEVVDEPDDGAVEAEKSPSITFEQAEEQAGGEIEMHVAAMDPYKVQRDCGSGWAMISRPPSLPGGATHAR